MATEDFWSVRADDQSWRKVLHLGSRHEIRKGQIIIHAGEVVDNLYFIEKGEAAMLRTGLDGSEKILMYIEEGTLFGETPFFSGQPILSTFLCSKNSVIRRFSKACVNERIMPDHPELIQTLLHTLAMKVSILSNQSATLAMGNLEERICKFLLMTSVPKELMQSPPVIYPKMRMKDLASLLGVHRTTLYKSIRKLEKEGIITDFTKDSVFITDMEGFKALAAS